MTKVTPLKLAPLQKIQRDEKEREGKRDSGREREVNRGKHKDMGEYLKDRVARVYVQNMGRRQERKKHEIKERTEREP